MTKPVILTGIRSNEEPTLANYLGAFVPIVEMQRKYAGDYQINMFVPDLHSFTTPIDHSSLYANTLKNLKYFIAAGLDIDNESTFIYRQSFIPAHSEMTWILDCFTYVGEMSRMTQFKDKSSDNNTSVTMGLMNYPVLMAADILLPFFQYTLICSRVWQARPPTLIQMPLTIIVHCQLSIFNWKKRGYASWRSPSKTLPKKPATPSARCRGR